MADPVTLPGLDANGVPTTDGGGAGGYTWDQLKAMQSDPAKFAALPADVKNAYHTHSGIDMTQNGGKGPARVTTMSNGQVVTDYPYDSGNWVLKDTTQGGVLGAAETITDDVLGTNTASKGSSINNLVNGSGSGSGVSGSGNQTALAQQATAQSTANSQAVYDAAIKNQQTALNTAGPAALDSSKYVDTTPTTAYAANATDQMRAYQAALAQTVQNDPNAQAKAYVTQASQSNRAAVGNVDTTVQTPTIDSVAQTGKVNVGTTTLDPNATALQGSEIAAANAIANGPSAAMSQFQAGESQVAKDQLAIAAGARGAERAGARREALINVGAGGAQANLSAAALAAQETQAKNVAASTALQGVGSQALTAATTQAQITSQQQQLQAQLDSAIAQGNTSAINTIKAQQAQLAEDASKATVQAGLTQQGTQAGLAQSNLTAEQQTALANAAAANTSANAYTAAQNAAMAQNAQTSTATNLANAGATNTASSAYTGAQNTAAQNYAAAATATSQANAALAAQQGTGNATRALTADQTNAANELAATGLRQTGANAALGTATGSNTTQATNASTIVDANKAQSSANTANTSALIAGAATVGAAALSDERAKTDIERASPYDRAPSPYDSVKLSDERAKEDVQKLTPQDRRHWAESIEPITWRYKDGLEDSGRDVHLGASAQEVERSGPIGRLMVHEDPNDHLKHLDYGAMTLMLSKTALDVANEALERAKSKGSRKGARP